MCCQRSVREVLFHAQGSGASPELYFATAAVAVAGLGDGERCVSEGVSHGDGDVGDDVDGSDACHI